MSASHLKVVVDHEGELSSSKKPILFLSFLFLQTDLLVEVGILDDLVQSRSNSRVQKFKSLHAIDREDFGSSTESAISTSLIHNVASEGKSEKELSWVLNLIFQHTNDDGVGEFIKLKLRYLQSLLSSYGIVGNFRW